MQEVDFASLTAREAAPDPTSPECGADMELYMQDCRQLLALGLKRWGGDAPGRLGPRVLNPDEPRDRAMIEGMFAPQPPLPGSPPLQQAPAQDPAAAALRKRAFRMCRAKVEKMMVLAKYQRFYSCVQELDGKKKGGGLGAVLNA